MNWKKPLSLFVAEAVLAMAAYGLGHHNAPSLGAVPPVQVYFSPKGVARTRLSNRLMRLNLKHWYRLIRLPLLQ
jgi:hypothetical protein